MNYSEVRPKIKTGDLLAWTHRSWKTWYDIQLQLVRFGTQSEYTHVGIAYCHGDRVFILESVGSGIRMYPLSLELPFYWIPLPDYWTEETTNAAFSKFGQKYSKLDGVLSVFKKIKPGADDRWECAEYAQWLMQQGGIGIDVKNTPSEVVAWALDAGNPLRSIVNG